MEVTNIEGLDAILRAHYERICPRHWQGGF
jgi:hypothetical protein